jgi:putative molybdopterin biosynthesis protein
MKKDYYLQSVKLEDALNILKDVYKSSSYLPQKETISVYDSLHRIAFSSVYATVSSPSYNASAMDGVTTKSVLTENASESTPITIQKEDYVQVNTGNVIPDHFDTVVMIEDIVEHPDKSITIIKSHGLYENIRPIGEDIAMGDMILPRNSIITPIHISALLAGGIREIEVLKKPTVAIIPTGDEIVTNINQLEKGKIVDSNSYFMKNELLTINASPTVFTVCEDDYDILEETILKASKQYDLVLIGAGSSAGTKDYANLVIKNNGTLLVHGISIKPGKPTIIGMINNTPIIGIPGYPVSTYISFELIVKSLIALMTSQRPMSHTIVKAKVSKKIYSSLKNKEYIRVQLGNVNNELIATPLSRGAGITMSLVRADGLLIVERLNEGYQKGDVVDILLLNKNIDVSNTLVSIGSHDVLLDIVNDLMSHDGYHLSSSHVGSFSGVLSMKTQEAHIAPVHILSIDGTYNDFLIEKYLSDEYHLVKGVSRVQGLYVKKGNPKNIKSLEDLQRKDVHFVNRQKGSGTRILLDYLLDKKSIDPNQINGYSYELTTHTLVAASVLDERYDTGLGVQSVASMYDLDFIEISHEEYDFLLHKNTLKLDSYKHFISVLQSKEFREKLHALGGYKLNNIGAIIK